MNFLMLLINFIITLMFLCQHCHSSKKALDRLKKCQKGEMFCGDPHWHQDEDNEMVEFELQHCKCQRKLKRFTKTSSLHDTTCSRDAYHRGEGQKVIGFSYYRLKDKSSMVQKSIRGFQNYTKGIKENLELMNKYYPDFVMRVYLDFDKNHPIDKYLCKLACENPNLDLCDIKQLPGNDILKETKKVFSVRKVFPASWRFFATLDSQVDIFMSRDLDSRLNDRELASVQDWINSKQPFHIIRDHPNHKPWPILAGLWGTLLLNDSIRNYWRESWKNGFLHDLQCCRDLLMFSKPENYGPDQTFLQRYVWPWAQNMSLTHDAYTCERFSNTRPFPTQRKVEPNNFVGSIPWENIINSTPCPIPCRPSDHPEWEYC